MALASSNFLGRIRHSLAARRSTSARSEGDAVGTDAEFGP
jgi:hypothetical protein